VARTGLVTVDALSQNQRPGRPLDTPSLAEPRHGATRGAGAAAPRVKPG